MAQIYDTIIIGGGIIGASIAYHLVQLGQSVLLIDANHKGKATSAGAGIISGATTFSKEEAMYQLVSKSSQYYPDFISQLSDHTDLPTGYINSEELLVALDEDHLSAYDEGVVRILERQKVNQYPSSTSLHELQPNQVAKRYPSLSDNVHKALLYTDAAQVDGQLLTNALMDAAQNSGMQIQEEYISKLLIEDQECKGVVVGDDNVSAETVIIAGGAWSSAFEAQLNISTGIFPQRGQIIHFNLDVSNLKLPIIISMSDYYLLQWTPSKIVVGATRESDSGFNAHSTVNGVSSILQEAVSMVPALSDASIEEIRVGLRPYSQDKLPLIGPISTVSKVWLATGHGPLGLTAGPLTGKIVAEQLTGTGNHDLSDYDPNRFANNKPT